jgi:hypothetical protein
LLDRILSNRWLWTFVRVDDPVRNAKVVKLSQQEVSTFATRAIGGYLLYRASLFWAYRLDRYRQTASSVVFSGLTVLTLIVQALVTFTLVNMAIFKTAPDQFASDLTHPGVLIFGYYSFDSLCASEISILRPVGSVAAAANMTAGFSTAIVIIVLLSALMFGFKQSKSDQFATEEIRRMRRRGDQFAKQLMAEYETNLEDLVRRVTRVSGVFVRYAEYLAELTPDDDDDDRVVTAGTSAS